MAPLAGPSRSRGRRTAQGRVGARAWLWVLAIAGAIGVEACTHSVPATVPDPSAEPTLVFVARRILTMDPLRPEAHAVAVRAGRIVAVGELEALQAELAGRAFEVDRRFAEHVLLPGFIDNHLHPSLAAALLPGEFVTPYDWVLPGRRVTGVRGRRPFLERLAELESGHGAVSRWLVAWGYHPLFHGELSRADLDRISGERPIIVWHRSFHEIYVNSRALEVWGITASDVAGHPNADLARGRFQETGLLVALPHLASLILDPERYARGLRLLRRLLRAGGLTTVVDQGIPIFDLEMEVALLRQVYEQEDSPVRVLLVPNAMILGQEIGHEEALALIDALPAQSTPHLRFLRQAKLFADGAFYSQLMQMQDGYLDGHEGKWIMTPEELEDAARVYWGAGLPIHVHVNGDLGVAVVLDVLETLQKEAPRADPRFVLHHVGYVSEAQTRRIAELGAQVSANPYYLWALADRYAEVGLGPERAHAISRLGSLVRNGVSISLHSDLTMAPARPLELAWIAVNRITAEGSRPASEERIDVASALRGITLNAARAVGMEHELGSIEVGKRADFTVLERDPLRVPPEELREIPIWGTVFEGRPFPLANE